MTSAAHAACDDEALGTHRTLELSPNDHSFLLGKEKKLGLKNGEVILTFDDGPLPKTTNKILDALKEECVKATFFAVGHMAVAYPKTLHRVAVEGHTVANHTQRHDRLPTFKKKRVGELVDQGIWNVEKVAYGSKTERARIPFFRYPYLARSKQTDAVIRDKGLIAFGANIDSRDWKKVSPDVVHDKIMGLLKREGKGIILMHDIQQRTANMLPRLLDSLKEGGYKVVHMVPVGGLPKAGPAPSKVEEKPIVVAHNHHDHESHEHTADKPAKTKQLTKRVKVALKPAGPTKVASRSKPKVIPSASIVKHVQASMAATAFAPAKSKVKASAQSIAVASRGWKLRSSQWIIR